MSLFSGISHFLGNIFGGSDEEKKKKQQQQQNQQPQRSATPSGVNQSQNPSQSTLPALPPDNGLNLVLPGQTQNTPAGFPPLLAKAQLPRPAATPIKSYNTPADTVEDPGVLHKLTHNPVTNVVGGIVHSAAELGNAALHTPQAISREIQNKPIDDINQQVFGTNDTATIAKKIVGDTANTALTVAAPGLSKVGESVAGRLLPAASTRLVKAIAPKVITDTALGGGFGGSTGLSNGGSWQDVAKSAGEGALVGPASGLLRGGIPLLRKAGDVAAVAPEEAIPGLRSVNPNQAEDAAKATMEAAQQAEAQAAQARAAQEGAVGKPSVSSVLPQEGAAPQAVAPTTGTTAPPTLPEPQVTPALETPAVPLSEPAATDPAATIQSQPQSQSPAQSALSLPEPSAAPLQASAAPNTHDALVRQLGADAGGNLKNNYATRDVINIDELKQKAAGAVANMSDEELVNNFATANPATVVHDPQTFGLARAALDRLYGMTDNPAAEQQVTNILDAMSKYTSKNAQGLRIVQEEFDNMPLPMKVRYLVKKIDAANIDTKGYEPLARDPAKADAVESALTARLRASQDIAERVAGVEDQLNRVAEAAKNGEKVDTNTKALVRVLKTERANLQASNGELVKYFQDLVPGRSGAQKLLVDFPKRMMLSSFTGRVNDLLTTTANVANLQAQNVTQGLLAKAVNLFRPGTVTDTLKGGSKLLSGAGTGLRKTAGEIQGKQYVDNLERSLRGNEDLRSGLQKSRGPIGRTIQAATEAATNVSEGVRDQRLVQLADQEGRQAGLSGDILKQYTEARAAVPSRQMLDSADKLHLEVNNLNENPISRGLNRISSAIEGKSPLGGVLKNQIMPFTSWLGGNIWNSVTDKNIVASTFKLGRDLLRGDAEGAVRNAARTINGAAEAYALGYSLSKSGLLTDKNAEGYNDGGLYVHAGDRYVPVGAFGFFAPNIVLGHAAHDGLENNGGKSPAMAIASDIGNYAWNGLAFGQALGVDNALNRAVSAGTQPGGGGKDATAVATGGIAGQFAPALGGDVNAVLNNGLKLGNTTIIPDILNPTHEAANTKVENPSSPSGHAKDQVKSTEASLVNRIPFASQQLPRKAGVAAADLIDRTVHGDRDTATSKQARADAKAKVDQAADFKKRDIPNFNDKGFDDKVEARVERGEYDKAIEGLQTKLDDQKKNKDIPGKKNKDLQDQISQLKVLKDGKFDPSIRDTYKSTSVSEWRNMGDPESDSYDPKMYQKLFDYDSKLANANISGSAAAKDKNKFTAKKPAKGRGGKGSAGSGLVTVKSNTIGSTPNLAKISLGDLAPQKAGSIKMPQLQQFRSSDLIKKRKISVTR